MVTGRRFLSTTASRLVEASAALVAQRCLSIDSYRLKIANMAAVNTTISAIGLAPSLAAHWIEFEDAT